MSQKTFSVLYCTFYPTFYPTLPYPTPLHCLLHCKLLYYTMLRTVLYFLLSTTLLYAMLRYDTHVHYFYSVLLCSTSVCYYMYTVLSTQLCCALLCSLLCCAPRHTTTTQAKKCFNCKPQRVYTLKNWYLETFLALQKIKTVAPL